MKNLIKEYNLSEIQYDLLDKLINLALEYNQHTNITAIKTKKEFWDRQIADSLIVFKTQNLRDKNILDVGTGGGFPGLVLAIAVPGSDFTLLDSNNKKTNFITHAIAKLNLKNVEVIMGRIEEMTEDFWEEFDITVSRAVAPLNILLELTAYTVCVGGKLILWKGSNLDDEIPLEWSSIKPLGIVKDKRMQYNLEDKIERNLIVFQKIDSTNKEYPREYVQIKSNPIY